ncbi:uncharacterized protein METZ01_LOCUS136778 [marine metagenome]|uniref:Uncharacterized protein n=1 Tax=marine metagenome TaxID=408172 RepID=A0A381Z467_9ZZZZ
MEGRSFRATGYPWRLFCGERAIENNLPAAVRGTGASRALVICSPSINRQTDLVQRIKAALGSHYAGVFDGIENDSTYGSVQAATAAAREADADLLVAVGGGSVIVSVRAVAIFLAEPGDPFEIMTQYPEGEPAYSPRLMEPKLSIINIPTTPTSAMNRAGTGLKNPALDQRMEYFDPKTRPQAIFLDEDALLTAPWEIWRSTSTTVFAGLVGGISQTDMNPLVAGDQRHAFSLAHNAYLKMKDSQADRALRMDMALAAFLQNRAEDDGRRGFRVGTFMGNYAVSTALHIRYPAIGQGESTSVVQAHTIRLAQDVEWSPAWQISRAIGISHDGLDGRQMALAVADWLEEIYGLIGMPTRLRQLDVPKDDLSNIAKDTVKNFNANSGVRSAQEQIEDALDLLNAAW